MTKSQKQGKLYLQITILLIVIILNLLEHVINSLAQAIN